MHILTLYHQHFLFSVPTSLAAGDKIGLKVVQKKHDPVKSCLLALYFNSVYNENHLGFSVTQKKVL